jgi:hypothetical protein
MLNDVFILPNSNDDALIINTLPRHFLATNQGITDKVKFEYSI